MEKYFTIQGDNFYYISHQNFEKLKNDTKQFDNDYKNNWNIQKLLKLENDNKQFRIPYIFDYCNDFMINSPKKCNVSLIATNKFENKKILNIYLKKGINILAISLFNISSPFDNKFFCSNLPLEIEMVPLHLPNRLKLLIAAEKIETDTHIYHGGYMYPKYNSKQFIYHNKKIYKIVLLLF